MYFQMDKPRSYVEVSVACAQLGIEDFRDEIYREEMAVLKETVAVMNKQLENERKRADRAVSGKEKLHEVKALRTEDQPQEFNSKILEMRNVIERQKELVGIMFKKHVTKHGGEIKMKLTETFGKKQKILAGESLENAKLDATEKDSGLCILCSNCSISKWSTSRIESRSDDIESLLKGRVSELEKDNQKLNEKIGKLQEEIDLLQEKHIAKNITYDAILNGIEKCVNEDKERMEIKLEDLKKRADLSEERCQMAKKHAEDIADRLKQLNENYGRVSEELEISKEELDQEKKKFADYEKLKKKEFDDVVCQMKKEEEYFKQNEEDLKKIVSCLKEDAIAARKKRQEMKTKLLSKEEQIVELENSNLLAEKELIEERKLKEEEAAAKEECAKQIVKLIVEKSQLVISNKRLMMKKNKLSLDYEKVKEDFINQGKILEKAQEYARDLEEEKYIKRLNKRKGWRKLRFWK